VPAPPAAVDPASLVNAWFQTPPLACGDPAAAPAGRAGRRVGDVGGHAPRLVVAHRHQPPGPGLARRPCAGGRRRAAERQPPARGRRRRRRGHRGCLSASSSSRGGPASARSIASGHHSAARRHAARDRRGRMPGGARPPPPRPGACDAICHGHRVMTGAAAEHRGGRLPVAVARAVAAARVAAARAPAPAIEAGNDVSADRRRPPAGRGRGLPSTDPTAGSSGRSSQRPAPRSTEPGSTSPAGGLGHAGPQLEPHAAGAVEPWCSKRPRAGDETQVAVTRCRHPRARR
jgi:hypothetical protein